MRLQIVPGWAEALEFIFCTGRFAQRNPAKRPKVILLDLKLPEVNGLEVVWRLKGDPRVRTIPVVVMSSSREERDMIDSYAMGVNSYIVKSMNFDEFVRSVQVVPVGARKAVDAAGGRRHAE